MNLLDVLKSFSSECLGYIRQKNYEREDEIIQNERALSVMKASSAFLEAEIPEEQSIALLQKYWDLRQSEAKKVLQQAKNRSKRQ